MRKKRTSATTRGRVPHDQKRPPRVRSRQTSALPRNRREAAEGIFADRDPVTVGRELLNAESESVKARAFETFADWLYGPEEGGGTAGGVRIVWDLPAPPRESR